MQRFETITSNDAAPEVLGQDKISMLELAVLDVEQEEEALSQQNSAGPLKRSTEYEGDLKLRM